MSQPRGTPSRAQPVLVRVLVPVAALLAGLALVACGSATSATNLAATEQASEREAETRFADFARCLREHGLEANTASGPGGKGFGLRIGSKPGTGPQKMEAAQKACQKYRPEPRKINLSPQEKVKREEEVLKFAKCMREHGIDLHAEVIGGAIRIGVHGGPGSGPNPESPSFQAAQKGCSGFLPFKGGPGKGVPPPKGAGGEGPSSGRSGGSSQAVLAIGG
ncbi:MAG: hypothetical protein ACLQBB_15945 [Solirubrobacteraceae bacterium]